jgi:hypothetical protein
LGHILSIIALTILAAACFWYAFSRALPYSNGQLKAPTHYYDYIVLLGSLLFVSVQGYLQFRFGILNENLGLSTLITACFFFYIAYRFDHAGVLSLAITALASFWGISTSPRKWYSADFVSGSNLHITAIIFGLVLAAIVIGLDKKGIKEHFTFTYLNFCLLIFFIGTIAGMLFSDTYGISIYLLVTYAGCGLAYYAAQLKRSFLFLLYAFLAAYIGTTIFLAKVDFFDDPSLWFSYSILSCGGLIYFIIRYRNYFSRQS